MKLKKAGFSRFALKPGPNRLLSGPKNKPSQAKKDSGPDFWIGLKPGIQPEVGLTGPDHFTVSAYRIGRYRQCNG
ncbi:hypothetical protein CTI12_AA245710 [Artemisia annua]|uniref:Uncharacterized protein n=1 Tax=Artemisia annua TaxID=35608 RepID=A0A2U1NN22_ARTAN|nr:hypothetical protein CTI12_AA245710 [Artemisia annua]